MNITDWAIRNKTTVMIFSLFIVLGGISAYFNMGKLKNPTFTIQTAVVITEYPGASAEEVELQVTEVIEKAAQKLGSLKHVRSMSQPDISTVFVDIQDSFPPDAMPQIWNNLRERIHNAQGLLPQGAGPPQIIDHFGQTYGVFLTLSGAGFSYEELRRYAEYMQKRLKGCDDVAEVKLFGIQPQQIVVELSRTRMATLGIHPHDIINSLQAQNLITYSGSLNAQQQKVSLMPTGNFQTVEDIRNLVVSGANGRQQVLLGDMALIERRYQAPPQVLFRHNGKPAIGIGISTVSHGNTVQMGNAVEKKLKEMTAHMPAGLTLDIVNYQSREVMESVKDFITSLLEAIAIVLVVLMLSLGFRSALVITNGLIINIAGTFLVMYWLGIDLQMVSVGSLILVLGMLVDDSVVVTDNVMVRLRDGNLATDKACVDAARATGWPQIVATAVACASFLPIDLAQSSTGQFCKTLFDVVAIALAISWLQAMIVVPVMSAKILKAAKQKKTETPYQNSFYRVYRFLLNNALRFRWLTVLFMAGLLFLAGWGAEFMKQVFMQPADRAQFQINYWLPEGTRIERTSADLKELGKELRSWPEVESVTTTVGSGPLRFLLTFTPQQPHSCYGIIIVNTRSADDVDDLVQRTRTHIASRYPDADPLVIPFNESGGPEYEVEARFSGDDPKILRALSEKAKGIMANHPQSKNVRDNWRNRISIWTPEFSQVDGKAMGITRPDVAHALLRLTHGIPMGHFRERDRLIPILVRAPKSERFTTPDLDNVPVWGNGNESRPLAALITGHEVQMQDAMIWHYDRIRTVTVQCNPKANFTTVKLRNELAPLIEAIPLPPGYSLSWGGMYEFANESNQSVYAQVPLALALMLALVVLLFNGVRQPLIIILTLPLSIIGITAGLLLTHKGFGFMAMLGMLSLIGMMIRNAVILIGEIDQWIAKGTERYQAVIQASLTRVRPVLITACTTTLGMIPLVNDNLFGSMAITIMGGLLFATVLTLVFIPTLYVIFFRIPAWKKRPQN
ncbi:MAG: efflux RND transporter permease subunit [Deltaproteobacteria bacterium]|jgi:multidrug efflux pump subunit AcrB|nr:efflux RND transporter permease subunit [Deltaproteobacteria bacterium]